MERYRRKVPHRDMVIRDRIAIMEWHNKGQGAGKRRRWLAEERLVEEGQETKVKGRRRTDGHQKQGQ